jgi:hypothetical protein
MQLKLKKFDISTIDSDKVVVLIGKRETGKSFLVKDLLHNHRDLPLGTVISPTENANQFFGKIVPPMFIHHEYTPETLENVVKRQKMVMNKIEKQKLQTGASNIDPRSFLLLDDCMYDSTWVKDKNIRLLFMNGRHYKIMFIITMQFPLGIPPSLRTQIDYVFILRENLISNRKRIYENYAGMFKSFDMFCQVLDQTTENFECLVIHNGSKSNKLEDQVFWYKAASHSNFKIGAKEFWDLSEQVKLNEACDDVEEVYDAAAVVRKPNAPIFSVKKDGPNWLN